jgi:hypothetical protein
MATMERLLLMAIENEGPGGQSLLGSIKIAVLPIVKVFTMCSLGLLMASKYVNILPASGRRLLNGVCIYISIYLFICHVFCFIMKIDFFLTHSMMDSLFWFFAVGFFTVATLFDILSVRTSCYFGEDA